MTEPDYAKLIDDAFESYMRSQFEAFASALMYSATAKTREEREAEALERFNEGWAFGKRARQLMLEATKDDNRTGRASARNVEQVQETRIDY